ncbi:trypsin-like serine protease [Agarivorans sp. Alg241-V36]|uniref:S1 family peptidase n=1 Tax=Agarivorans sp. Alg241-V36 TaxID=2305992 RepID=UPI0013CFEDEC|nr:serine protease [Agarivorans sp. Alg241-V36]
MPIAYKAKFGLLALTLFSGASLASPNVAVPYVVGGQDAPKGAYPWMAQLKAGSSHCGAVLIDEQWLLSAAHCTFDQFQEGQHTKAEDIIAFIGEDEFNYSYEEGLPVAEVCQHPNYVDFDSTEEGQVTGDYDLVLMRLTNASSITPIAVNQSAIFDQYSPGFGLRVIGYGRINNDADNPEYLDELQQADLSLTSVSECSDFYGAEWLTGQMFCADSDIADSCSGDSGGPLFIDEGTQYKLAGIVSWGTRSCANAPGVYADVGKLSAWINQVIQASETERTDPSLCSQLAAVPRPSSSGGGAAGGFIVIALLALCRFRKTKS